MFAYFSADTDEAQVMQHTRPAPRPLLPISSSLTAMNFIFFFIIYHGEQWQSSSFVCQLICIFSSTQPPA